MHIRTPCFTRLSLEVSDPFVILKLLIPDNVIGCVIGKGGETMKQIKEESDTQIFWNRDNYPGTSDRPCLLKGVSSSVKKAHQLISDYILEKFPGQHGIKLLVPDSTAGRIIGKGASSIRDLMKDTGATVEIPRRSDNPGLPPERIVIIEGEESEIKDAMSHIYEQIVNDPRSREYPDIRYSGDGIQNSSARGGYSNPGQNSGSSGFFGSGDFPISDRRRSGGTPSSQSGGNFPGSASWGSGNIPRSAITINSGGNLQFPLSANMSGLTSALGGHNRNGNFRAARGGMMGQHSSVCETPRDLEALEDIRAVLRGSGFDEKSAMDISNAVALLHRHGLAGPMKNEQINVDKLASFFVQEATDGGDSQEEGAGFHNSEEGVQKLELEVEDKRIGLVFGPQSRDLRELMAVTGTNVVVSSKGVYAPGTENRIVTIEGSSHSVLRAKKILQHRLDQDLLREKK